MIHLTQSMLGPTYKPTTDRGWEPLEYNRALDIREMEITRLEKGLAIRNLDDRELLVEVSEFLRKYEDADHDGEHYVPNKAMRLRQDIDQRIEEYDKNTPELEVWLCPPHRSLDKRGALEPLDNCVACLHAERNELRARSQAMAEVVRALEVCKYSIEFGPKDWAVDSRDAWLYGILVGWDEESIEELRVNHGWSEETVQALRTHRNALAALEKKP